ncbi:DM13 domain-containing protein [Deinococcus alpinitundrae]|uniref:DM13 domain-containing protein n=1 Tax=Deinococcus alpinitundrae TaxID=468913 RepID=UPI00137B603C|nr:DM13 domain-containing protein [Deinococcus alpinitundrae]
MTIPSLTILTLSALLGTAALAQTTDMTKPAGTMSDTMKDSTMNDSMGKASQGSFKSVEAPTSGKVSWSKSGENYLLKITGLKTEAAPDLKVWLYQDQGGVKKGATNLKVAGKYFTVGSLKKFGGDFSFTVAAKDLPKDMGKFNSVVLWCDQVSAAFGIAALK